MFYGSKANIVTGRTKVHQIHWSLCSPTPADHSTDPLPSLFSSYTNCASPSLFATRLDSRSSSHANLIMRHSYCLLHSRRRYQSNTSEYKSLQLRNVSYFDGSRQNCCSLTLGVFSACSYSDLLLSCSIWCVDPERGMPWLHLVAWLGLCQVVVRLTWST